MEKDTGLKARADSRFHLMQILNAAESLENSIGAKNACASSSSWQSFLATIMPCAGYDGAPTRQLLQCQLWSGVSGKKIQSLNRADREDV